MATAKNAPYSDEIYDELTSIKLGKLHFKMRRIFSSIMVNRYIKPFAIEI